MIWKLWRWPQWNAALLMTPFVIVDVTFFSANFLKLFEGAWAPLLFGATLVLMILTWRRGSGILISKTRRTEVPIKRCCVVLRKSLRIPCRERQCSSLAIRILRTALLHNLKHNKVLHE